ncbi:YdgH/BhsA/McbA-like domain containing protein [Klebsiella oxytoca]
MKKIAAYIALTSIVTISLPGYAAKSVNDTSGLTKTGVVSAANAQTIDELSEQLSIKADKQGSPYYKILSTSGKNKLHGVAALYK